MNSAAAQTYHRRTLQADNRRADDLAAIIDLALQSPVDDVSAVALPYQLSSWALDEPENLALWHDSSGELAAFALHQIPFATLYYGVHPGADQATVETEIFRWGRMRAREIAAASGDAYTYAVWPEEQLASTHDRLHQEGYTPLTTGKVFFLHLLETPIQQPRLPPGFRVRHLAGEDEVAAATDLLQTAFDITTVTEGWRRRILLQPQYRAELDVVIDAPNGQLAAFCLLWLDPASGIGQIEPMATHPAFQRRGLGHATIAEGLHRLQKLGGERVLVGTSSTNARSLALYQSAGFAFHHRCSGFQCTIKP